MTNFPCEISMSDRWQINKDLSIETFYYLKNHTGDDNDDDDDDDDDDNDDKSFFRNGWPTKMLKSYFQPEPILKVLTNANTHQTASRIWTFEEPEFKICWVKLCTKDNQYSAIIIFTKLLIFPFNFDKTLFP